MTNGFNDGILMMLNEDGTAEAYDDTYDIVIHCKNEEEQKKTVEMLKNSRRWIPIEERLPEEEKCVIVSFSNCTMMDIASFRINADGSSAFYPGDEETSYAEDGIFVNAWMPLLEPYKEGE